MTIFATLTDGTEQVFRTRSNADMRALAALREAGLILFEDAISEYA